MKENSYRNETLFSKVMEKLGLVKFGRAEDKFAMFSADPCVEIESLSEGKKEDGDERMFKNFQPKLGVATEITRSKEKLFRSKEYKKVYA